MSCQWQCFRPGRLPVGLMALVVGDSELSVAMPKTRQERLWG